jgi:hypothetical protein
MWQAAKSFLFTSEDTLNFIILRIIGIIKALGTIGDELNLFYIMEWK